jgi:hypothetical protein
MVTPSSKVPIEFPIDLEPVYSNIVRISHTLTEFVFDFARLLPGNQNARIFSRMIMSPIGAKLFYRALGENLARFEANYGEIPLPGDSSLANDLFRSIHPPENPPTP